MTGHARGIGALAAVGGIVTVGTLVLVGLSWGDPVAEAYYWRPLAVVNVVVWLVFALVGALIVLRRPGHLVGSLLGAIGLGMLVIGWALEYAIRGLLVAPATLPVVGGVAIIGNVLWIIPFGLLPILLLVYPTGSLPSARWRLAVVPAVLAMTVVVAAAIPEWRHRGRAEAILLDELPATADGQALAFGLVITGIILLLIAVLGGVASLVVRWRTGGPVERLQIKWLLFASGAWVGVTIVDNLLAMATGSEATTADASPVAELVSLAGIGAIPVSIGVAILRYRLYEIDRIVSRTVTYGLVTGVLVGVYVVVAVVPAAVFDLESDLLVAGATLVAAAAFGPVRRRVQALVDHRFNRARYDARLVADTFAGRLRDDVDLDELAGALQGVVAATVEPAQVSLWLREPTRTW